MKIKKVENKVLKVLQERPETRSDDFLLIYYVFKECCEVVDLLHFDILMLNHKNYNLPSFHSVTRSRRKLFEKYPELKPEKITKYRIKKEEEFKNYALNRKEQEC